MIIKNTNGINYREDTITLIFQRDKHLFTDNEMKGIFYTDKEYNEIVELLVDMFNGVDIPDENIEPVIQSLFNWFYEYHYNDRYKPYKKIKVNKGTSPSSQIDRDIKNIIEPYEKLIKKIYKGKKSFKRLSVPREMQEHYQQILQLKKSLKNKESIEFKSYCKPEKPTKKSIDNLFLEIEDIFNTKFSKQMLNDLKKRLCTLK